MNRVIVAGALAAIAAPANAVALNPPPPDFYSCLTGGGGTVCHGKTSGVTRATNAVPARRASTPSRTDSSMLDAFEILLVAHGPHTMFLGHIDKLCTELA